MRENAFPVTAGIEIFYVFIPVAVFAFLFGVAIFAPEAYQRYIASETGLLEISHILVPLAGAYLGFRLLKLYWHQRNRFGIAFGVFAIFVCLYIAGEEASYGQHFFGWEATGRLAQINDQQETNLHNISSWFDQKPRVVLELSIMLGGLLLPIFPSVMMRVVPTGLRPYAPSLIFLPTAVLTVLSRLPERLDAETLFAFNLSVRYSEKQEFFMTLFITLYIYYVLRLEREFSREDVPHARQYAHP